MGIDRRTFLKGLGAGIAGTGAAGALLPRKAKATSAPVSDREFVGILVDTTRCIGCRSCEKACAEAHGLPVPDTDDFSIFSETRRTNAHQLEVVNRYETPKGEVYVKKQCMHCNQPACVSACPVKAMEKHDEGAVTWNDNCIGCRYCMTSCPYDIPKFEHTAFPELHKCDMCYSRTQKGLEPACVEACPAYAITFGTRREMIDEANRRIYSDEKNYVHHIYGEQEAGGSGYMYLSSVPFEQIGFRTDIGTTAYPEYTKGFLYSVPVILLLWPAFMSGIATITKRKNKIKAEEGGVR